MRTSPCNLSPTPLPPPCSPFQVSLALTPRRSKSDHQTLPRRGEKDFEPHGTRAQADVLAASRGAMHDALALRRAHAPGARPVGYYDPCAAAAAASDLDCADGAGGDVVVPRAKGQHFRTMGRADRRGALHLRPEEALYLLERGSLELRARGAGMWGGAGKEGEGHGEEGEGHGEAGQGLVVGLQSAYATLLGREGLTLERFQVFAGLRRSGYIVQRAPDWGGREWRVGRRAAASADARPHGLGDWLCSLLGSSSSPGSRPLVALGLYRSYGALCLLNA